MLRRVYRRLLMRALAATLMLATLTIAPTAFADDDDDWRRSRRADRDGWYGRNRDYGYGRHDNRGYGRDRNRNRSGSWASYGRSGPRYDDAIVSRTLADLRVAASRNRVDSHEREHFRRAMSSLQQVEYELRSGRFNDDRLDDAMEDLRDLAQADQVHPRDRQILGRDLMALRNLRNRY